MRPKRKSAAIKYSGPCRSLREFMGLRTFGLRQTIRCKSRCDPSNGKPLGHYVPKAGVGKSCSFSPENSE
jgi:hypothetical protein